MSSLEKENEVKLFRDKLSERRKHSVLLQIIYGLIYRFNAKSIQC